MRVVIDFSFRILYNESVEKLFSERNFQLSREKNEEGEGILRPKSAAD